jgi:hypothetical protein
VGAGGRGATDDSVGGLAWRPLCPNLATQWLFRETPTRCVNVPRSHIAGISKILISPAAFAAIAATLPIGTVAVEPERAPDGSVGLWLDHATLTKLNRARGPDESYSSRTGAGSVQLFRALIGPSVVSNRSIDTLFVAGRVAS